MVEDWRTAWAFNVIDEYKSLTVEEIRQKVKEKTLPFAVCMQNIQGDFNFSSVVRSANALGAREVFYFGKKKWDRRGAVGTYKYTDVSFVDTLDNLISLKKSYSLVSFEYTDDAIELPKFVWPINPLIIVGEENSGITQDVLSISNFKVKIPQFGSVRSMNAAVAASIAMYDFTSKWGAGTIPVRS